MASAECNTVRPTITNEQWRFVVGHLYRTLDIAVLDDVLPLIANYAFISNALFIGRWQHTVEAAMLLSIESNHKFSIKGTSMGTLSGRFKMAHLDEHKMTLISNKSSNEKLIKEHPIKSKKVRHIYIERLNKLRNLPNVRKTRQQYINRKIDVAIKALQKTTEKEHWKKYRKLILQRYQYRTRGQILWNMDCCHFA